MESIKIPPLNSSLNKVLITLTIALISLFIISCNTEKKLERKNEFGNELSLQWNKYLINIKKIIEVTDNKKTLIKVKNDMVALYIEGRDEYENFPDDIAIKVSRLSEKIDQKIRPKMLKKTHSFKTIDIVSQKIEKITFLGAKDDGSSTVFTEKDLKSSFLWPLKKIYVTSPYGFRNDPFHRVKIAFHHGIDLAGATGDYILSSNYGKVIYAETNGGYGLMVIISHKNNISTVYGHLDKISVKVGTYVRRGEVIGEVGSTGKSTGPHLHFEIRKNNRSVDPIFFIESQGIK